MSDTCGYIFRDQWAGYGTYNDGNPDDEQFHDLPAPETDSGQGAYSGIHRYHCFVCNNRTVCIAGIYSKAYLPSLNDALGVYIPLIVVNCIILGRAESYASKNPVIPSIFDGIGMGLGFTVGLTTIGIIREILGSGSIFGFSFVKAVENFAESHASDKVFQILSDQGLFQPASIFVSAPGAFLVLAFIIAFINRRHIKKAKKTGEKAETCRLADCASCANAMCAGKGKEE
mgnify:CR=1 FL=1